MNDISLTSKFKIVDILTNTGKLVQILQKENILLEQKQFDQIGSLLEEKESLLDYLDNARIIMVQNPDILADVNENTIKKLKEINKLLAEVSSRNEMLLKRAIAVNAKVIEIVNRVVNREREKMLGYNKNGSYGNRITENIGSTALTYNNNI